MNDGQKVHSEHLKRDAYLYVRQSTLHQVVENTESTDPPVRPPRGPSSWAGPPNA